MFKKKVIAHIPESSHLISKVPDRGFKKGYTLEKIKEKSNGTQEIIKNSLAYVLKSPVELIFLVKSNRKVIQSNWGTRNRIKVNTSENNKLMGGFGHIELSLMNPPRYIATRMQDDAFTDEKALTQIALNLIPKVLHSILPELEPLNLDNESSLITQLTEKVLPVIKKELDSMGILCQSIVIENINFEEVEEG